MYCAATAADCPFVASKQTLIKMAAKKDCPGGTECPGGCCPEPNWYCCPDGMYCAATAADCPFVASKQTLIRWAPRRTAPEVLSVLEDAAQNPTGTAALMACTVPPLLLTAHLLLPSRL